LCFGDFVHTTNSLPRRRTILHASLDDGTDATTDADDDARRDRFERR
jgi:hypothetical protein